MESKVLVKRKRAVLLDVAGTSDSEDPSLLAMRWAESLASNYAIDTSRSSGACEAIWFPRHRVAVLTVMRGKMIGTFGETGVGGQTVLLPEEALFLAERGYLTLFHGGNAVELSAYSEAATNINNGSRDNSSSSEPSCLPRLTSTVELYQCLTEAAGVPLLIYLAYRHLRDREMVVRRPLALVLGNKASNEASPVPRIDSGGSVGHGALRRVSPRQLIPDIPITSPESPTKGGYVVVAFEAWPWTATFSKARCGAPILRIAVARAADSAPSILALSLAATPKLALQTAHPPRTIDSDSPSGVEHEQDKPMVESGEMPDFMVATVDDEGLAHCFRISAERTSRTVRKQRAPV